jgi:hypothetical protein
VGLVCLKGTGCWNADPVCLGIPGLKGLGCVVQQNGDHACVYLRRGRPWGHGPAEIVNVCGSPALRAHLREIMWV